MLNIRFGNFVFIALLASASAGLVSNTPLLAADVPQGAVARLGKHGDEIGFGGIYRLAFSPDGKLLAGRGSDQVVRVWEIATGKERFAVDAHEDRVQHISFTDNGKQLMTASPGVGEKIRFWDIETGKEVRSIDGQAMIVRTSDDGSEYVAITPHQFARLSASDGKELSRVTFSAARRAATLSSDASLLASVSDAQSKAGNGLIALRDTNEWTNRATLKGLTAELVAGEFSPDSRVFAASARRQPYFYLWRLDQLSKPGQVLSGTMLKGHTGQIQAIGFSPDGRTLATASWDGNVRLWEVLTGGELATLSGHSEHVVSVAFSPDGTRLASGAAGRTDASAIVWNLNETLFGSGASDDELAEEQLAKHWQQLGEEQPGSAYDAIASLRRHPKQALELFADKLGPVLKPTRSNDIAELIKQLDDDSYKLREEATQKLIKLRALAQSALEQEIKKTESAEVRYRIRLILETPPTKSTLSPVDQRTTFRLIYVLELIGNDAAREQVAALSTGHADVNVLREATAALERMGGNKAN